MSMFAVAIAAVLVSTALALVRALAGPTMFDRVLAANSIGTLVALTLALIGFVTGRPDFLDLAILYTMLNLIGTVAVLRYFRVHVEEIGDVVEGSGE